MPTGWMPDALHDTRMKPAWPAIARREMERRARRERARTKGVPARRSIGRPLHGAHA